MKVVFHIDELSKWKETRSNVLNLLKEPVEVTIVVLVNGQAITGYLDPTFAHFLANPAVAFHACSNAMNAFEVTAEELPERVEVVPAGVLDLITLQQAGFAYIKP